MYFHLPHINSDSLKSLRDLIIMVRPIAGLCPLVQLDPLARPPITSNIQYFTSKTINTTHMAKNSNTLLLNLNTRKFPMQKTFGLFQQN